jgi:hypothetical protein
MYEGEEDDDFDPFNDDECQRCKEPKEGCICCPDCDGFLGDHAPGCQPPG